MKLSFGDVIGKIKYHLTNKEQGYNFPLAPNLNEKIGNILPGTYTVVAGLPSSGTTSFVDQQYVMSVLLQWYFSDQSKPLKVFYFSMVDSELKKLQALLCNYLRVMFNIYVDIPTLNSQPGRLFDIEKEDRVLNALDDAQTFFDCLINDGVLEIIGEPQSPSVIYNTVESYMDGIGVDKQGTPYELNEGFDDITVLAIVDKTDHLAPEIDQYASTYGNDLNVKFDHNMKRLATRYRVSPVIIVPAVTGLIRSPKDTEPHYKQLGVFGKNCDRGIILYNPIAENNINRYFKEAEEVESYMSKGKNTLRFWSVVRNTEGIDSIRERLLFLPGTGFMVEHPLDETISNFDDVYEVVVDSITPFVDMKGVADDN
jgi:hypothetical protein